jgi:hypothetical protein
MTKKYKLLFTLGFLFFLSFSCKKDEPKYKYEVTQCSYRITSCDESSGCGTVITYLTIDEAALKNYSYIKNEYIDYGYCPGYYDVKYTSTATLKF